MRRERFIRREDIVEYCNDFIIGQKRLLILQAGPGHGKSIAARQIAEQCSKPFFAYHCTPADKAPHTFFQNILTSIKETFNPLTMQHILKMADSCGSGGEFLLTINSLLQKLFAQNTYRPFVLIVEDLHILDSEPAPLQFIKSLYDSTPRDLSFIVTSRMRPLLNGSSLFHFNEGKRVFEQKLSFSRREIQRLYRECYRIRLTEDRAEQLYRITDGGWPLGLSLLRSQTERSALSAINFTDSDIEGYFICECLGSFNQVISELLTLLSIFDAIPLAYLEHAGMKEAQGALESLMDRALFVYRLEKDGQTYFHYHHLFRETLRKIAERELGAEAWGSFARSAADWLFGQSLVNEAILLLSRAQQWRHLAQVFSEHGQALICQNNLEVAAEALSQCPRVEIERERWLCTILGHALLIRTPPEAISLLAKGRELAGQAGDQACELQACLGLIMYEMFIEANIGKLKAVLARAGQLYETLAGGGMASSLSYLCAYLLCFATAYCHAQYDRAESYITLARDTCQAPPEHGLEHQIVVAQAFNLAFQGDIGGGLAKLQKLFARDLNQLIGPANQFLAHAAYLNFSLMKGDIEGYKILRREMQEHFPELMAISYIGSFVNVWDMDLMLSEGRMDQVLERAEEALANPLIASNAHIKSQCLQYQAAALAFLGRSREARAVLRRSMRLRAKAGGRFFTLLNRAMAACVLSLCPDHPEPERLFDLTLAFADQCEDSYVKPQLLAYRAHLRLRRGNERAAMQDIQDFLGILESRRSRHFFLWESGMMKELLCHFHSQGHDNVAARTILRERFQLEEGPDQALLPILQCDTARGRLYFADASEEEALDIHELPANEYRLLNKLIASPGKYLCLDDLGDNLWGEGLWPKDPRNSLYQLLNKLRGRLQAMRPGLDGKLYIVSKPGYVKIDHIRFDLEVALRHMERADRAVEAGHYWAADIWQQKACNIIDGFGTEYVFPATLTQKMDRSMEVWLGPIIERGAEEKALRLLEAAIKASPHNDGYHQARYRLLLKLGLPARAREAERQYARLLGEGVFEGSDLSGLLERS